MSAAAVMDYDFESATMPFHDKYSSLHLVATPRIETYSYMPIATRPGPRLPKQLPLFAFIADGNLHLLSRPIMLRTTFEDGEYIVENDTLRIFGVGASLRAAYQAFSHDFAYYWQYYRSLGADEVAGDGAKLKKLYEELVAA